MAGTQAVVEMSATDKNVLALLQTIAKGFDKLAEAQTRVEQQSAKTEKVATSGFEKMISGAGRAVIAYAGITSAATAMATAIRLATANQEALNAQLERARQAAVTTAGGQLNAALSFAPDESMKSMAEMQSRANTIADRYGVPLSKVYELGSTTMGARGTANNATAWDAAEAALRLAPNLDNAQQNAVARSTLGLMNTYKIDADTAKGMMVQGAREHNVDIGQYAQFVVPAIKNLGNMGASAQEAFSLTAGLANAQLDPYGRESGTGSEGMMRQLVEATARFPDMRGKGLDEMLKFLQTDERGVRVRRKLLGVMDKDAARLGLKQPGTLALGSGVETNAMSIINGVGEGWEQYQDARNKAVNPATAAAMVREHEAEIAKLDLQQVARSDLASQRAIEIEQLQPGRAQSGVDKKTFDELIDELPAEHFGPLDRATARLGYWGRRKLQNESEARSGATIFSHMKATYQNDDSTSPKLLDAIERAAQAMERSAEAQEEAARAARPTVQPNGDRPALPGARN